jgi:hypothetical protein
LVHLKHSSESAGSFRYDALCTLGCGSRLAQGDDLLGQRGSGSAGWLQSARERRNQGGISGVQVDFSSLINDGDRNPHFTPERAVHGCSIQPNPRSGGSRIKAAR